MFDSVNQAHQEHFAVLEGFDSKLSFTGKIAVAC